MLQLLRSGKLPAAVTLILLSLLVLDLFVLEKKRILEIVDNGTIDIVYSKDKDDEDIYYLITKSQKHIRVNQQLYNEILIDDTIALSQTSIFNRTARIAWNQGNYWYYQNINPLNKGLFTDIFIAVLLAAALLKLLNLYRTEAVLDYLVLLLAGGLFAFYLN